MYVTSFSLQFFLIQRFFTNFRKFFHVEIYYIFSDKYYQVQYFIIKMYEERF